MGKTAAARKGSARNTALSFATGKGTPMRQRKWGPLLCVPPGARSGGAFRGTRLERVSLNGMDYWSGELISQRGGLRIANFC